MPVLGLGTYEGTDKGVALRSVRDALEVGYRLIDTAQYYGNEQYIGQALKDSGVAREEIFLTSKIWFNRFEACYEAVLESLRTLQVDYLDLILLHWPFGNTYGLSRSGAAPRRRKGAQHRRFQFPCRPPDRYSPLQQGGACCESDRDQSALPAASVS